MQVIFLKDMKKQAKKGDIKEVKDGYAAFLIKEKIAEAANQANIRELKRENKLLEEKKEQDRENANKLKKELEKVTLGFKVKVGDNDKMFGSVTQKQIKEKLEEKGFKIDKKDIKVETAISTLGYHDVNIELYKDIRAKIKIHLEK